MSTKIHYGVRFPLSRLGEFAEKTRIRGLKAVETRARELLDAMKDPKLSKADLKLEKKERENKLRWKKAGKLIELLREAAKDPQRSIFDLTFGWNLYIAPGAMFVLASPWGSMSREAGKLVPKWVEEYGYWDNTDRPDEISARKWRQRELDWEIACAPDYQRHPLNLYVFDAQTSRYTHDMSWLELRLVDHKLTNGKPFGTPAPSKNYSRFRRKIEREIR